MGAGASVGEVDGEGKQVTNVLAFKSTAELINKKLDQNKEVLIDDVLKCYMKFEKSCRTVVDNFPGARGGLEIHDLAQVVLKKRGVNAENTLFAQSVCPDEINHECGDITNLFSEHLGEVFHMGGLAGLPFTGKTGFTAFSHHVPDDGNLFILVASHIGISDSFKLGMFSRIGQDRDGAACGAAVGAFNHCCEGHEIPDPTSLGENPGDYQMQYLISEISKRKDKINEESDENKRQAALSIHTYEIARTFLDTIVTTDFGSANGRLIILGGVQINMPRPMSDFFCPLNFEIRQTGKETIDLMTEAFGSN